MTQGGRRAFRPEGPEERIREQAFSRIGWGLLAFRLSAVLLGGLLRTLTAGWAVGPVLRLAAELVWYGIGLGSAWRLMAPLERRPFEARPARPGRLAELWCMAFSGALVCSRLTGLLEELLERNTGLVSRDPTEALLAMPWPILLIQTCVLAPVVEEVLFRRIVLERLRPWGDAFAVGLSALLFALLHGDLAQMLYAWVGGLALGWAAVETGRLRTSILLHALLNGATVVQVLLTGRAALWYTVVLMLAAAVGMVLWLFRRETVLRPWERSFRPTELFCCPGMLAFLLWTVLSCVSYLE